MNHELCHSQDTSEFSTGSVVRITDHHGITAIGIVEDTKENDAAFGLIMCRVAEEESLPAGWRPRGLVKVKRLKSMLVAGQMVMEEQ
jgi:hypothetical protein